MSHQYVQLGEVNTYVEEDGDGDPLVLLHPGGADARAFGDIVAPLAEHFHLYRPDRRGHGRTPDVDGPVSYDLMAQDTVLFLEQFVGGPAYVFGHSDGAPVGLLTALLRPDLVRGLVFASGVFHHTGWAPGAIDFDDETMEFFTAWHGEVAPDGPDHFPLLYAKLDRMHRAEPTLTADDLAGCTPPILVLVGDGDDEIPYEHTIDLHRALPHSQLAIVPGTGHGLPLDKPDLVTRLVVDFYAEQCNDEPAAGS